MDKLKLVLLLHQIDKSNPTEIYFWHPLFQILNFNGWKGIKMMCIV